MNKRIAVITLDGLYNYGNRLQNLAVQRLYEREGCRCETLVCKRSRLRHLYWLGLCLLENPAKTLRFYAFNRKYISIRRLYLKNGRVPGEIIQNYDLFCVGSDQVWNPHVRRKDKHIYYLQFASREKRIALAPSIAVDRIPEADAESFVRGISGFDRLSVREKQGAELIRSLTGLEAQVLVDPTLAFTAGEWEEMLRLPEKREEAPYILVYFLGEVAPEWMREAEKFARERKLRIVSAYVRNGMNARNAYDPADFVRLVRGARYVFTDSFHGVAFSIIFNRSFYAFSRREPGMDENTSIKSRISSILEMTGLENHLCWDFPAQVEDADYGRANVRLEQERAKVARFVRDALQGPVS